MTVGGSSSTGGGSSWSTGSGGSWSIVDGGSWTHGAGSSWSTGGGSSSYNLTFHYVGCFQDKFEPERDLSYHVTGSYTPLQCMSECARAGFQFSASQFEKECRCGNTYNRHGPSDQCQCHADNIGWLSNCVYKTDGFEPQPSTGSQTSRPSPAPTSIRGFRDHYFVDCFKDQYSPHRDLPNRVDGLHTPIQCMNECASRGFKFSGSQWEKECWCGDTYNKHGEAEGCDCHADNVGHLVNCIYNLDGFSAHSR